MNAAIPLQPAVPAAPHDQPSVVRKHSRMGLASLLIALGLPLLFLVVLGIMILLQGLTQNAVLTNFIILLVGSFVGAIGHGVGLVLGIVGATQKRRKKVLPVLGIVFNSIPMLLASMVCIVFVAFLIHPFPLGRNNSTSRWVAKRAGRNTFSFCTTCRSLSAQHKRR